MISVLVKLAFNFRPNVVGVKAVVDAKQPKKDSTVRPNSSVWREKFRPAKFWVIKWRKV